MSLVYSRIVSCFITVNTLFLLFSFITVESAFKMAAIQVLFNSIQIREVEHSKKKLVRKRIVSLSDVQPPSVYKSHILNGPINKLYVSIKDLASDKSYKTINVPQRKHDVPHEPILFSPPNFPVGGRVLRWCWVNFQCRRVLQFGLQLDKGLLHLQWVRVGVVWTFLLSSIFSLLCLPYFGKRPDID